jgi:hypothetical protein
VSGLGVRKTLIVTAMFVGALAMWTVNPLAWLWVTSRLESSGGPSMGPYALLLGGITVTCVALGKLVSWLNRLYARITGTTPTVRVILPVRRSLRGGRSQGRETDGRLPVSVLDFVMVASVVIAVIAFAAWMLIANPTPPNIGGPGPAKR